MEKYTKTYEKQYFFIGFSRFPALSKHTILNIHPVKNLSISHRNFERTIYKKSSRNLYFLGSHFWTNFSMNFTQFREGFGRVLGGVWRPGGPIFAVLEPPGPVPGWLLGLLGAPSAAHGPPNLESGRFFTNFHRFSTRNGPNYKLLDVHFSLKMTFPISFY